jgi:formate-dependent nitrite reductase membrane component NrfD
MRVVAILDPARTPNFTWEGTLHIILFVGGVAGALFGVLTALLRRITTPRVAVTVVVITLMGLLVAPEEPRTEFIELGAGPWVNIPMFIAVVTSFGFVMLGLISRFERVKRMMHIASVAGVQAMEVESRKDTQ